MKKLSLQSLETPKKKPEEATAILMMPPSLVETVKDSKIN